MGILSTWLESLYEPNSISERCLRKVSPNSNCSTCIDNCNDQAIELVNGIPILNTKKCKECQVCVTSCPTLAIDGFLPKRTYMKEYLIVNKQETSLTTRELLFLHKKGIRYLYEENGITGNEDTLRKVNEWLAILQLQQIKLTEYLPSSTQSQDRTLTRRELFQHAKASGKRNLLLHYTPASWRKNQGLLKHSTIYSELTLYQIDLDTTSCTLCGACSSLCPENAVQLDEANSQLHLDNSLCSGCTLCAEVCPDHAISINQLTMKSREKETHSFFTHTCERCNNFFRTWQENEKTCIPCQYRESLNGPAN